MSFKFTDEQKEKLVKNFNLNPDDVAKAYDEFIDIMNQFDSVVNNLQQFTTSKDLNKQHIFKSTHLAIVLNIRAFNQCLCNVSVGRRPEIKYILKSLLLLEEKR